MIRLERVTGALPPDLDEMRAEARAENHTMLDTLAREWASGETRFDRPGSEKFWETLGFVPDRRDGRTHILGA